MKAPFALAIVAAAMLAPALAHAQAQGKTPVFVDCQPDDRDEIGKGLCSSLRDVIARSPRYTLLTTIGREAHNVIDLSSLPLPIGDGAIATSAVFGFAPGDSRPVTFLTHTVLITPRGKVDQQATNILVDLDSVLDTFGEFRAHPKATP